MAKHGTSRILVVEDEADIAALVAYQLAHAGFQVRTASSGDEALRSLESAPPDLVILDLMLPGLSGTDVMRAIRSRTETEITPVIMLTARGEEEDRLRGFELGADDYITKPFSPRELVMRVRAVLRRSGEEMEARRGGRVLRAGPIEVNVEGCTVSVAGQAITLTPKEFKLLVCLIERRGRTQSRSALLEAVWETTADIATRTVDMHVGRLRAKLKDAGELIETVRGFGYRLRSEEN